MIAAFVLCAVLGAAPSPVDVEQAKAAFETAERAYRMGDFEDALANYRRAYSLYPRPEFLFNIGQAQRGLRNWREAAFSFELYLRDAPDAEDAAEVKELIKKMNSNAEAAEKSSRLPPVATVPPPPPPQVELQAPRPDEDDPVYKKWWFWTAIGAVVVAGAATGAVLATQGASTPSGSLGTFDYR